MRWRLLAVVAIAVLAISAQPAAAANASAVASERTTFGTGSQGEPAPTQLIDTRVEGSGAAANVTLAEAFTTIDGFEDGDLSEYGGDIGSFSVQSSTVYEGSQALESSTGGSAITDTGPTLSQGEGIKLWMQVSSNGKGSFLFGVPSETGAGNLGGYGIAVDQEYGSLRIDAYSGSGTTLLERNTSVPVPANEWVQLHVSWQADGTISVSLYDLSGSKIGTVSATDTTYTSGGVGFRIDRGAVNYDSLSAKTGLADQGAYIGAPHDAEDVNAAWTNLSLSNASATVTWQEDADDDGVWGNVTSATYSTSGNVTQNLSATESDHWRVRVDIKTTGADPVAKLHDEGLLFDSSTPTFSHPEPPDEMQIQQATGDVSINVSDADFALAQGDNVSASAVDGDGNSLGSTTLTSNGTASLSYSSKAGPNTIQWTATDDYGNTDTFTQTFSTPGVIEVRNESEPGTIISTASNITATFYGTDDTTVVQKSSPNGTIPIAGVPTDTEYVVAVNANGYRPRRVRLTNLFDQRSVYLLPDSADSANIQFELNDRTGNFPSDSELIISKPITRNNSTEYVDIAADSFGATGSTRFILEDNSRYLLRVKSPDGSVREIGSYTTSGAAVEPIPIGRVSVGSTIDSGGALQTGYITEDRQTYLRVTYADPDGQTESLTYRVVNETGAVIEPERTVTVTDEYRATIPVDSTAAATVNYSYTRQTDGGLVTKSGNATVGGIPGIAGQWPIDQQVLSLSGYLLIVGVTGLLVIRDPGVAAFSGTVVASLLTFIGVVAIPYMALGVAGVTAVLFNVGRAR